ncbi:2OG-Fe(II) oxygenase [Pedobacter sp. PWIIR3]
MENKISGLIDTFIENRVGISNNFLSKNLSTGLQKRLHALNHGHLLLAAGTGNATVVSHDKKVRGDKIYWLDRKHNNAYENSFFDLIDQLVYELNSTCYTGITGYEFHYTLYEKGHFYKKHLDQFKNNTARKYSVIIYLNEDWTAADGGELRIHHADWLENIAPTNGKGVFFQSDELEHEVLVTHKSRLSITGWLRVDQSH